MILTDSEIMLEIEAGNIVIKPFSAESLGSNSYDVHLSEHVAEYDNINAFAVPDEESLYYKSTFRTFEYGTPAKIICSIAPLDAKAENKIRRYTIPEVGLVLEPGRLYLMSTVEYTETHKQVPILEGKSSTGRLGIDIHATAGKGDIGFKGHWTLEVSVALPVRVYAGMPIGQLIFLESKGVCLNPYDVKKSAKYADQPELPQPSAMYKNFS